MTTSPPGSSTSSHSLTTTAEYFAKEKALCEQMTAGLAEGVKFALLNPAETIEILFKEEIARASDSAKATDRLIEEYTAKFAHPYAAAARGYIDDVIDPRDTRPRVIEALRTLRTKRDRNPPKKHGNIPL